MYGDVCAFSPKYTENLADRSFQVVILDDVVVHVWRLGDLFRRHGKAQRHVTLCGVPTIRETVGERLEIGWGDENQQGFRVASADLLRSLILDVKDHVPPGFENGSYR